MYLANSCNSTVIETYVDIMRVSHGFDGCQMLEYIADTFNLWLECIRSSSAGESHPHVLSELHVTVSRHTADNYSCSTSSLAGTLMGTPS